MKKIPRTLPTSVVFTYLEKCRFSALIASCGHLKNAMITVIKVLLKIAKVMKLVYFI
jgi:hypothetical protein